jgi:RimJ/RimL family protein N-acetyltransferase
METFVAELLAHPTDVSFVVTPRGRGPEGIATLMRADPANGVVEIGGILLARSMQRTPASTEAMYLLAHHVFDALGYRRYEWKCDSLNEPSRRAAARLGFTYEGRFRQALVYKGRNRDTDWFSITDAEWPRIRAAHEAWLDPANFDDDGGQRQHLGDLTRIEAV